MAGKTTKHTKCYIYTRVSTNMQIDGYSLESQREEILSYCAYKKMEIVGEYSDEGKSGKNIAGRPSFSQMIEDVVSGKDDIDFIVTYNLSRFGRNAADVISTLQLIQDYGVNLRCVKNSIDSSDEFGKFMITILSAVAEMDRENIIATTMAGREQKAREGKWNGGQAPYGYVLKDGMLEISEPEAEHVRLIFDKYVHTSMSPEDIAVYFQSNGIKKVIYKNRKNEVFTAEYIKKVLDNITYCGKISYGKRKSEKIEGERNKYHMVTQAEWPTYQGVHQPIVTEEVWLAAKEKRARTGVKWVKTHSLEHEHLLSGVVDQCQ